MYKYQFKNMPRDTCYHTTSNIRNILGHNKFAWAHRIDGKVKGRIHIKILPGSKHAFRERTFFIKKIDGKRVGKKNCSEELYLYTYTI